MNNSLQYDNGGKPYFEYLDNKGNTQRTYVSPVAMDPNAQLQGPGESAWHSANQWNARTGEVENPFKWGKLITAATAAGLGGAALNAGGLLGGAGGGPTAGALDTVGYGTGSGYGGLATTGGVLGGSEAGLAGAPALGALAPDVISGGGVGSVTSGGGGVLGGLKSLIPTNPKDIASMVGQGLGGASSAQASNRGSEFYGQYLLELAQQAADKQHQADLIAREQEGRTGAQDAWRKLQSTGHLLSPAPMPNVSPYAAPQRTPTNAETTGANALSAEVLKRLQGGNPIPVPVQRPLTMDPSLLKPGALEKTSSWLSPILALLGKR
jgi:hypothetical protein